MLWLKDDTYDIFHLEKINPKNQENVLAKLTLSGRNGITLFPALLLVM